VDALRQANETAKSDLEILQHAFTTFGLDQGFKYVELQGKERHVYAEDDD
jgi:hypothetical protein